MKLLLVGGAQIAVHRWGERGDIPVVFWHALGPDASGADLAHVAGVLADAGFQVVAVDRPGFARSPLLPAQRYRLAILRSCTLMTASPALAGPASPDRT